MFLWFFLRGAQTQPCLPGGPRRPAGALNEASSKGDSYTRSSLLPFGDRLRLKKSAASGGPWGKNATKKMGPVERLE